MKCFGSVRKKENGFSLVELMTALAIIAILTAIAVPAILNWLPNYRLKNAARTLFSNIQLARMTAVKTNAPCAMVFNAATNAYFVCTNNGADNLWATTGDNTILKMMNLTDLPGNIRFGHGVATVPLGGAWDNEITFASVGPPAELDVADFTVRGILNQPTGYVYLQNNEGVTYGISVLTSGAMTMQAAFLSSPAIWD